VSDPGETDLAGMGSTSDIAPPDIAIVPIGPEDATAMAPIHAASFAEAWTVAVLTRLLRADAARAFGAFAGYQRSPLGFVLAFAAADEAEILTIAVAENHRRAGIGARLLRMLEEHLAEDGIERLFLEVAADNTAAYGLYRRRGFVETGRRKAYYQRPNAPAADALTLALTLAPPKSRTSDGPPSPTGH
jgi:[ribosomal protein S18]-alanine N-acetyltransferase